MMLDRTLAAQWKNPMKIYAAALCAVGAALVSACGGGGDSATSAAPAPAAPPPAAPAPPSVSQLDAAALRLYESAAVHASLTASPLVYAVFYLDEVWTSGPCAFGGNGSLQTSLDGVSPAKGTVLPPGSHTFAVTFANCLVDGLVGVHVNGTASADYTTGTSLNDLTALVSANLIRGWGSLGFRSDLHDVTADGSGTWTRVRRDTGRSATTYTPTIGSRLVNNLTTNVATFGGGSYSTIEYDPPPELAALVQQEFNNLVVAINGTGYILSGSLHSVYGFNSSRSHSGEVQISSSGTLIARIYGDESGTLRTDVLSALIPF